MFQASLHLSACIQQIPERHFLACSSKDPLRSDKFVEVPTTIYSLARSFLFRRFYFLTSDNKFKFGQVSVQWNVNQLKKGLLPQQPHYSFHFYFVVIILICIQRVGLGYPTLTFNQYLHVRNGVGMSIRAYFLSLFRIGQYIYNIFFPYRFHFIIESPFLACYSIAYIIQRIT